MVIAARLHKNNYKISFNKNPIYILLIGVLNCIIYGTLAMKGNFIGKMINDVPALIGYSSIAVWLYMLDIDKVKKFFIFTGSISFSLYLLHVFVLMLSLLYLKNLPIAALTSIALIATYIISIYYQKAISKLYNVINI
jgi:peptidoglycan/LPS O-acetylase OafA/YrhL